MNSKTIALVVLILLVQFPIIAYGAEGGPNAFGYIWSDETVTYNWIDTSGGSVVYPSDDDYDGPFDIGFSFNYYGTDKTTFYISSNGFITFGSGTSDLSNDCPISSTSPREMVAVYWDDLDPGDTGDQIRYQTFGTQPNRYTVIEYDNVCHYPGGSSCDRLALIQARALWPPSRGGSAPRRGSGCRPRGSWRGVYSRHRSRRP